MRTRAQGKLSLARWSIFALVTALLAVAGGFVTVGIGGLLTLGTDSCGGLDERLACSDWPMGLAFGGWIAAILAAAIGALLAARKQRSLWIGYPVSVLVYLVCALTAFALGSN